MDRPFDYEGYKRDTAHVVRWVLTTFNKILRANPLHEGIDVPEIAPDEEAPTFNRTGKAQCRELLSKVRYISRYVSCAPSEVLRRLRSAIRLREEAYAHFQKLSKTNPRYANGNKGHKDFINVLQQMFEQLGGSGWLIRDKAGEPDLTEQEATVRLINYFEKLHVEHGEDVKEPPADEEEPSTRHRAQPQRKKKGKAGKKRPKTKKVPPPEQEEDPVEMLENLPLERFEILPDEDSAVTDHLIAVHGLIQECVDVRRYIQDVWHDVAYDELNSAVAGALTNTAIAAVTRRGQKLQEEFGGTASYDAVNEIVAGGDIAKIQGQFGMPYTSGGERKWAEIDVTEQFMVPAYRDLVEFVTDYRLNRNGKPTKRMQKELARWNPDLNLVKASMEERLLWRRLYTLNWLYELVRVYTYPVAQSIAAGKEYKWEDVDWSPAGPWASRRRLFGLDDFAAFLTTLATQKPGAPIADKIRHHHVLQLQLLVDSFAVTRGWAIHVIRGHVLETPTAGFECQRDIDMFLDRDEQRGQQGFLPAMEQSMEGLKMALGSLRSEDNAFLEVLEAVDDQLTEWLGAADPLIDIPGLAPPRFPEFDGLWRYSPLLCGVGLEEALEMVALLGRLLCDALSELIPLMHVYNMLTQRGYLEPIDLFEIVLEMYPDAFFEGGEVPESDFMAALFRRLGAQSIHDVPRKLGRRDYGLPEDPLEGRTVWELLQSHKYEFFTTEPLLIAARRAGWDPAKVSPETFDFPSLMGWDVLRRTPRVRGATGERFADTPFVKRVRARSARASGLNEADLVARVRRYNTPYRARDAGHIGLRAITDGSAAPPPPRSESPTEVPPSQLPAWSLREYLDLLRVDFNNDVCGKPYPRSGINYFSVASLVVQATERIVSALTHMHHNICIAATRSGRCEPDPITVLALLLEADEAALEAVAMQFEDVDFGYWEFNYWDVVEAPERRSQKKTKKKWEDGLPAEPETCVLM